MGNNSTGTKEAVGLVKDRPEPIFDDLSGTFICGEEIRPGLSCKGTPIAPRWRCRRHGGDWKPTEKAVAASKPIASIYDPHRLWDGFKNIRKELTAHPELIEQLYTTDIGEELAVSRIVLAEILKGTKIDNKTSADRRMALQALKLIGRIAKTAEDIREKKDNIIKQEFLDGIIAAITHAFIRANDYERKADRARIFMSEFAAMLPGNVSIDLPVEEGIIDGEVVGQA